MKYHAYEISAGATIDLGVDTDPAALLKRLAADLNNISQNSTVADPILYMTVGTVEADSHEAALNEIRAGNWIKDDTYGTAGE